MERRVVIGEVVDNVVFDEINIGALTLGTSFCTIDLLLYMR